MSSMMAITPRNVSLLYLLVMSIYFIVFFVSYTIDTHSVFYLPYYNIKGVVYLILSFFKVATLCPTADGRIFIPAKPRFVGDFF